VRFTYRREDINAERSIPGLVAHQDLMRCVKRSCHAHSAPGQVVGDRLPGRGDGVELGWCRVQISFDQRIGRVPLRQPMELPYTEPHAQ
jgi:hypothetical protein